MLYMIVILTALSSVLMPGPAYADSEASNVAHVAAGPDGRCYARSIPDQLYDPKDQPRQQGHTQIFHVRDKKDVLAHTYDWFSQKIFVKCGALNETAIVRTGPWHRGHDPRADHLALAFYRGGKLLKRYSTLDIAGGEKTVSGGISKYRNVSASVSHYTVFKIPPKMVEQQIVEGSVFTRRWVITATTIDGRALVFDLETGMRR